MHAVLINLRCRACAYYCVNHDIFSPDPAEAVGRYTSAIAIEPHYAVAQCNLAAALAKLGEHQQAIFAAQAALRTNKNYEKVTHYIQLLL